MANTGGLSRVVALKGFVGVMALAVSAGAAPTTATTPEATTQSAVSSATSPTEAEKETARSLMDQGDALVAQSDWQAALKHYRAAHQIMGVPTTGIEVARVQAKLGQLVEARTIAIEVANLPLIGREPAVFTQARAAAAELADELEGRIPSVIIEVEPREVAPRVHIDDAVIPLAALGLPFKVNPGVHHVRASASGYAPVNVAFTVDEGERRSLPLTLVLEVMRSEVVSVSGEKSMSPAVLPADEHDELVMADNGADGAATRGFVALGVAGAAGLVGGGAGIYSLMKTNEAQKKHCDGNDCAPAARSLIDQATTSAWVANVGVGVAAVALVYAVYELAFNTPASSSVGRTKPLSAGAEYADNLPLLLTPQANGAAVSWSGTF